MSEGFTGGSSDMAATRISPWQRGENYPDALVVGPYLAKDGGILLLTHPTTLPGPIRTQLVINRDWVEQVDSPGLPAEMIAVVKGVLE